MSEYAEINHRTHLRTFLHKEKLLLEYSGLSQYRRFFLFQSRVIYGKYLQYFCDKKTFFLP